MKTALLVVMVFAFGFVAFSGSAEAYSYKVKGYYKKSSGTYVQPHYKTSSDRSRLNNYSTRGNYNPYTGKKGYTSPYRSLSSRSYRSW